MWVMSDAVNGDGGGVALQSHKLTLSSSYKSGFSRKYPRCNAYTLVATPSIEVSDKTFLSIVDVKIIYQAVFTAKELKKSGKMR
jgi:hypothetical protein